MKKAALKVYSVENFTSWKKRFKRLRNYRKFENSISIIWKIHEEDKYLKDTHV